MWAGRTSSNPSLSAACSVVSPTSLLPLGRNQYPSLPCLHTTTLALATWKIATPPPITKCSSGKSACTGRFEVYDAGCDGGWACADWPGADDCALYVSGFLTEIEEVVRRVVWGLIWGGGNDIVGLVSCCICAVCQARNMLCRGTD